MPFNLSTISESVNEISQGRSYRFLNDLIERNQSARRKPKNIEKILLRERITGRSIFDSPESLPGAFPYLEYNAQTWGDLQSSDKVKDLRYTENLSSQCGKSVVWLHGTKSDNMYLKKIHCKKQWCPECGGKGGRIHKSRMHSILSRVDVSQYHLSQWVLTVPEETRDCFQSPEGLAKLENASKEFSEKFYGEPVFDKFGHVKRRKLKKGVISYLHPFGDEEPGVFKPHINLHIFEEKRTKMKLEKSVLDTMRAYWLKKIKAITGNQDLTEVDIHYSFRMSARKKMHAIKYMSRPWSAEDYAAIEDEELKRLLVVEMKGFLYMRFWGALANCRYRDEMSLPEIKKEVESVVGEPLKLLFVAPFDEEKWASKAELIGDGLYRIKSKYSREELWNYRECMDFFDNKKLQ